MSNQKKKVLENGHSFFLEKTKNFRLKTDSVIFKRKINTVVHCAFQRILFVLMLFLMRKKN